MAFARTRPERARCRPGRTATTRICLPVSSRR